MNRIIISRIVEDDGLFIITEAVEAREGFSEPFVTEACLPNTGNPEEVASEFHESIVSGTWNGAKLKELLAWKPRGSRGQTP